MIPVVGVADQTIAVLGLGRSGRATAAALAEGGANVIAWDDNEKTRARAADEGLVIVDLTRDGGWTDVQALITSPGIPHLYPEPHPAIAQALKRGIPVDNDIGLFFRSFATDDFDGFDIYPKVVAITGSNGKSTTSALLHHILTEVGRPTQLGGNIGTGVLSLEPAINAEVVVLELSSYQTELARGLTPDIAVLTNISPDHLSRHGGLGGYFAAKRRLFAEGGPDRAVIGVEEVEGQFLAGQLSTGPADDRVIRISTRDKLAGPGWSVTARKGFLSETRKNRQVASIDLREISGLPGSHNHQNACCAYAVARSLGLAPRVIEAALHSFAGLPHRSQFVAEIDGVRYVNDSKATNVDAAAKALAAFDRVRWIAGGQGKEGGITALSPQFDRIAKAYLIGHSAPEFAGQLGDTPHEIVGDMARAVAQAHAEATPGDTVLLAPASASFDQYASFEARGDHFLELVQALKG